MLVGGSNDPLDLTRIGRTPTRANSDAVLFAEIEVVAPARAWLKRLLKRSGPAVAAS